MHLISSFGSSSSFYVFSFILQYVAFIDISGSSRVVLTYSSTFFRTGQLHGFRIKFQGSIALEGKAIWSLNHNPAWLLAFQWEPVAAVIHSGNQEKPKRKIWSSLCGYCLEPDCTKWSDTHSVRSRKKILNISNQYPVHNNFWLLKTEHKNIAKTWQSLHVQACTIYCQIWTNPTLGFKKINKKL